MRLVGFQLAGEDEEMLFNPDHVVAVRKGPDAESTNIFVSGSPHQAYVVSGDVTAVREKLTRTDGQGR